MAKRMINTWPIPDRGGLKALASITLGNAITFFPIKMVNGKNGMYLKMPRSSEDRMKKRPTCSIRSSGVRFLLTSEVVETYHPDKPWFGEYGHDEPIRVTYCVKPRFVPNAERIVADASIEIDGAIRVGGIRMFQLNNRVRLVRFPEHCYRENGEYCFRRIIEFHDDWEDKITTELWAAYDSLI